MRTPLKRREITSHISTSTVFKAIIYGVQSHRTIREALYVNTRTKIAIVVENALAHQLAWTYA
jgi:hypothetical protein